MNFPSEWSNYNLTLSDTKYAATTVPTRKFGDWLRPQTQDNNSMLCGDFLEAITPVASAFARVLAKQYGGEGVASMVTSQSGDLLIIGVSVSDLETTHLLIVPKDQVPPLCSSCASLLKINMPVPSRCSAGAN